MKISFVCTWMKTNFQNKIFALSLAFIMRFTATRKWPVTYLSFEHFVQQNHSFSLPIAMETFEGFYSPDFVSITCAQILLAFRDVEFQYRLPAVVRYVWTRFVCVHEFYPFRWQVFPPRTVHLDHITRQRFFENGFQGTESSPIHFERYLNVD